LISVEKKFGEEALEKAKHIMNELMTQAEMKRIQELSGIAQPQEGAVDDLAFGAGKIAGKVQKGATDAMGKLRQGVSDIASNFQSGRNAGMGQGSMPAANQADQPAPPGQGAQPYSGSGQGTTAPGGQGPRPSQPMPKPKPMPNQGQAAREDLDAMLRIAGLR
jgi:hypothetical protein